MKKNRTRTRPNTTQYTKKQTKKGQKKEEKTKKRRKKNTTDEARTPQQNQPTKHQKINQRRQPGNSGKGRQRSKNKAKPDTPKKPGSPQKTTQGFGRGRNWSVGKAREQRRFFVVSRLVGWPIDSEVGARDPPALEMVLRVGRAGRAAPTTRRKSVAVAAKEKV